MNNAQIKYTNAQAAFDSAVVAQKALASAIALTGDEDTDDMAIEETYSASGYYQAQTALIAAQTALINWFWSNVVHSNGLTKNEIALVNELWEKRNYLKARNQLVALAMKVAA